MTEDTKLWLERTLGKKSYMNLFGKIALSPLILLVWGVCIALVFLFTKRPFMRFVYWVTRHYYFLMFSALVILIILFLLVGYYDNKMGSHNP
jgi:hypothetical protein